MNTDEREREWVGNRLDESVFIPRPSVVKKDFSLAFLETSRNNAVGLQYYVREV